MQPKQLLEFIYRTQIKKHGPLFHHVYIWTGRESSAVDIQTSYQYCLQLLASLSGSVVVHREVKWVDNGRGDITYYNFQRTYVRVTHRLLVARYVRVPSNQ